MHKNKSNADSQSGYPRISAGSIPRLLTAVLSGVLFFLAASPANAQYYVKDQFYRCSIKDLNCKSPRNLPAFEQPKGKNFTINYVEFNDQGEAWWPQQLQDAVAQITAAHSANGKAFVVVYVHGWKNNADEKQTCGDTPCNDVSRFRDIAMTQLAKLACPEEASCPSSTPPVVGIFLAWHGLSLNGKLSKQLTPWTHSRLAKAAGKNGMHGAVKAIQEEVSKNREKDVLYLMGHSFGARALEFAVDHGELRPGLMEKYRAERLAVVTGQKSLTTTTIRPPADLIFYVNAATSSQVTRRTIEDTRKICAVPGAKESEGVCKADPLYLAVSAGPRQDWATGVLLPIAFFPVNIWRGHVRSAANSADLRTHKLPRTIAGPAECPATDAFCFEATRNRDATWLAVELREKKTTTPFFWVFRVHGNVIREHGDVWNQNVLNMLLSITRNSQSFQTFLAATPAMRPARAELDARTDR